jgi:WD40 repeat protein
VAIAIDPRVTLHATLGYVEDHSPLVFSADGRTLAAIGSDRTGRMWDASTGRPTANLGPVEGMVSSLNGSSLTATDFLDARTWNMFTGQIIAAATIFDPGQMVMAGRAVFSPDGYALAIIDSFPDSYGNSNDRVRVWDVTTGRLAANFEHLDVILYAAFSPDASILATVGRDDDGIVRIWNPATGQLIGSIGGLIDISRTPPIQPVFSPHGHTLATVDPDRSKVLLWDTTTRQLTATLDHANARPVFSPDGRILATIGNDGTLRLWDPATGRATTTFNDVIDVGSDIAFSPDGRIVAINNHTGVLQLWYPAIGQLITNDELNAVGNVVFSPDSRIVAINDQGLLRLWDPATDQTTALEKTSGNFAFSPDGRTLATVSWAGRLRLWNVPTP